MPVSRHIQELLNLLSRAREVASRLESQPVENRQHAGNQHAFAELEALLTEGTSRLVEADVATVALKSTFGGV